MIVCQVCGTQNPDGARFCDGCGVELAAKPIPTIPEARETDLPENSTFEQTVVPPIPPVVDPQLGSLNTGDSGTTDGGGYTSGDGTSSGGGYTSGDGGFGGASASSSDNTPAPVVEEPLEDVSGGAPAAQQETPLQESAAGPISPESTPAAPVEPTPEPTPVQSAPEPTPVVAQEVPTSVPVPTPAEVQSSEPKKARLAIKKYGVLSGDAIPLGAGTLTLGRFDASTGPVDIDVTGLPGAEHVSRRHAQLQFENGQWLVKDLGSTNGVFVRRSGDVNFGPRIAEPTPLQPGDELAFGNLLMIYQED